MILERTPPSMDPDGPIRRGEVGGAIELWSSSEGLSAERVILKLDEERPITGIPSQDAWIGDPEHIKSYEASAVWTRQNRGLGTKYNDTDDPKVTVRGVDENGGDLVISTGRAQYYVLRGLPEAAKDVWQTGIMDLKEKKQTEIPFGNSTHNMLLVRNSRTGEPMLVVMAVNLLHGFAPGKLTPSLEHQQHPDKHGRPVDAVVSGFKKEFGLDIPEERIRLHGVAVETKSAYVCTIHIADMTDNLTEQSVIEAWGKDREWPQGNSVLMVPVSQLDQWKSTQIPSEVWSREGIIRFPPPDGQPVDELPASTPVPFHHTGPLRIVLLQQYLHAREARTPFPSTP